MVIRIRPPPLSQIFNRPPPILPQTGGVQQPFTPLPPRSRRSPLTCGFSSPPPLPHQLPTSGLLRRRNRRSLLTCDFSLPHRSGTPPLPFGCIPSPKSPYGALFSPTGQLGLPQLPLSPTPPLSSPRWKGIL
ncbi:VQ motif-containing protein 9-like [Salvia splendens]|uniref:VQ motif-containing protein 9-like n=1 Tax=Salvia splendens TaxID=180675 RepID=UPI001C28123F|nr:VQ motif-containing protein 9-like [Salvia splendens]